jgi:hypothetical protein
MRISNQKSVGILRRYPWAILSVGLLTGMIIPVYLISNRMMSAKPMTEAEVAAVSLGGEVEATLEVTGTPSEGVLQGTLLERQGNGTYQRTNRTLSVRWRSDTPVVMGKKADVHRGAVIQIKGKSRSDRSVDAERIVILTGYVTVR